MHGKMKNANDAITTLPVADAAHRSNGDDVAASCRTPCMQRDHRLADWQARKVQKYIDDHLDRALSVDEIALVSDLSPGYFARSFKGSFGLPPHAYILARRVERARAALLQTDDAICEIALVCGLADQAHLTRTFRRQFGMPPAMWRRMHRVGAAKALATKNVMPV